MDSFLVIILVKDAERQPGSNVYAQDIHSKGFTNLQLKILQLKTINIFKWSKYIN